MILCKKAQNAIAISTEFSSFPLKDILAQALHGIKRSIDYFLVPYLASIQISCADSYASPVTTKTHGAWVLLPKMGDCGSSVVMFATSVIDFDIFR